MPDDFKIAPEPAILDGSLVDSAVYMRWETFLWHGPNATPRLVKKLNLHYPLAQLLHRQWADGSKGPAKLQVDNYGHGSHARYNSWVILTPATGD